MSAQVFQTYSDTATRTRALAGRLGTQLLQEDEWALEATGFSAGTGPEGSSVRTYLAKVLPGIEALGAERRLQSTVEADTIVFCIAETEAAVARPSGDWAVALASIMQDLSHAAWPSPGHSWSRLPYGAETEEPTGEETSESPEEELETVDWDVRIETPPPRRAQRVVVTFRQGSYRPPRFADDPED